MIMDGYVVVRLPQFNCEDIPGSQVVPCIGALAYVGADRLPWRDLFDESYYHKTMPSRIYDLASAIMQATENYPVLSVCESLEDAMMLLQYMNRSAIRNEIIYVRQSIVKDHDLRREQCRHYSSSTFDVSLSWIGYDMIGAFEWSIISSGVFWRPDYYQEWIGRINAYGLFDTIEVLMDYAQAYEEACERGISEPLAKESAALPRICVLVARVASES
jgi:hypothetical protein